MILVRLVISIAILSALLGGCASAPEARAPAAASAPCACELPLSGELREVDEHGYPRAYIDRVALQDMLRARRFSELTAALEAAQRAFEEDWRKEYWPHDAVEAFTADPAFAPLFDAWVAASPGSWAPLAARGSWLGDLGTDARGTRVSSQTTDEQFDAMEAYYRRAVADLNAALRINPKLVAASRALIAIGTRSERAVPDVPAVLRHALAQCPNCLHVRTAYILHLEPRWGGSYEEMEAFAREAMNGTSNPRLQTLGGYALMDRAQSTRGTKERRRLLDEAIAMGEASDFFRERSNTRIHGEAGVGSVEDMRRAVTLRPAVGVNHAALADRLAHFREYRAARDEIRLALRLDGSGAPVRSILRSMVGTLRQHSEALDAPRELLSLALELETEPDRRAELEQRLANGAGPFARVPEPAAWTAEPPTPEALAALLDDAALREAAWCRLLARAAELAANKRSLDGLRCAVKDVMRSRAPDGSLVRVVVIRGWGPRGDEVTDARRLRVVDAAGKLLDGVPLNAAIGTRSPIWKIESERVAFISWQTVGARPALARALLVLPFDSASTPLLRVVMDPAAGPDNPRPLTWRTRDATATTPAQLEVVTHDAAESVVATFTWDATNHVMTGPTGSRALGFLRVSETGDLRKLPELEQYLAPAPR